jgi:hypothetical protein
MATTLDLTASTGVSIVTDIDQSVDIPVLGEPQRQGDVIVLPIGGKRAATRPVPAVGCPVVRGENGGNTHAIYAADGPVFCDTMTADGDDLRVALLSVPEGSTAYLGHPEHGFLGLAAGSYEIRRQREHAEEMSRLVAD